MRQRSEIRVGFGGNDDLNIRCSTDFLEELPAVATGSGRDGE